MAELAEIASAEVSRFIHLLEVGAIIEGVLDGAVLSDLALHECLRGRVSSFLLLI